MRPGGPLLVLMTRLVGGLLIVLGLLSVSVAALFVHGPQVASAWFQLVQGVVLGVLGWIFGSQGVHQEVARADEEAAKAERVAEASEEGVRRLAQLESDLAHAQAVLRELAEEPEMREKIEAVGRQVRKG